MLERLDFWLAVFTLSLLAWAEAWAVIGIATRARNSLDDAVRVARALTTPRTAADRVTDHRGYLHASGEDDIPLPAAKNDDFHGGAETEKAEVLEGATAEEIRRLAIALRHNLTTEDQTKSGAIKAGWGLTRSGSDPRYKRASDLYDSATAPITPEERTMITTTTTEDIILQTDASGAPVRLEYVRGHMKWEASPASRHQKTAKAIEASLRPITGQHNGCAYSLQDVLIRFPDPDHSLKRPDIAIFCDEPPDSDEAIKTLPAAVIEILSLGYEEKDLGTTARRSIWPAVSWMCLWLIRVIGVCCTINLARARSRSWKRLPPSHWRAAAKCM